MRRRVSRGPARRREKRNAERAGDKAAERSWLSWSRSPVGAAVREEIGHAVLDWAAWGEFTITPIADMLALRELMRPYTVPIDSPEAWPDRPMGWSPTPSPPA